MGGNKSKPYAESARTFLAKKQNEAAALKIFAENESSAPTIVESPRTGSQSSPRDEINPDLLKTISRDKSVLEGFESFKKKICFSCIR